MPDQTTPATPAIDTNAIATAVAAAVAQALPAAIQQANAPLIEQLGKLQPPAQQQQQAQSADGKPKPLTAEDVSKLVSEQITKFQQSNQQSAQRDAFVNEKMKDIPAAYRSQLGSDPSKWQQEEQQIRQTFQADLKAAGVKPENVGNDKPGGTPASAAPADLSKLSPVQLIAAGLKDAKTADASTVASRTQTATGTVA